MDPARDPTAMELAVACIVGVFNLHSGGAESLTKCQAKDLLKAEMPELVKAADRQVGFDCLFDKLDSNSDGKICFSEFIHIVGGMATSFNEMFKSMQQCQK
ncbi:protein S100-A11-like [Cheilinus undulatus]|uniref:protein S100-A11-like n=1 Tax=Cheilinus undulatus TaxID=241271 RepID=UPI001BD29750|nr:protein S100-A11-like [Cheilinus undulatus]